MENSPWNSLGQNIGVGSLSLLQRIFPTQGSNPGLPHCRWIHQLSHKGRTRITGVGSLALLQGIFLTQESNPGLLHCRWILYHLSYQAIRQVYTNHYNARPVEHPSGPSEVVSFTVATSPQASKTALLHL